MLMKTEGQGNKEERGNAMKTMFYLLVSAVIVIALAVGAYAAPPENVYGDYEKGMYEDAEAPFNDALINAKISALKKSGKVVQDKNSIGSITVQKGAVVYGPMQTNVDMKGGSAIFDATGKSKKK